jgi:predicted permease
MDTLWQDVRYGLRTWIKTPAFTAVLVLTLAFGIGANATVFTVINTLFLNPLPVANQQELVIVRTATHGADAASGEALPVSRPNLMDLRERNQVFQSLAAHTQPMPLTMLVGNAPVRIFAELATADFFDTLGVRPVKGRFFLPGEDAVPGASPVAVMTYGAWQQRFGGANDIVGRTLNVNGTTLTVIGVTPEGFKGVSGVFGPDIWVPSMMAAQILPAPNRDWVTNRSALGFHGIARLKPGVTRAQAEANLSAIASALEREYPEQNRGRSVVVDPLTRTALAGSGRLSTFTASALLMLLPALVLLIACSKVASLLLARATGRRREIAMRLALGSGARRLTRQLLTESVLLAVVSGAIGFAFAYAGVSAIWSFRPTEVASNLIDVELDTTVLVFTAAVSLATGVLFGVAPAWQAVRTSVVSTLNEESHSAGPSRRRITLGRALLVGQVALSLVSLMTAGLLLRSVQEAYRVDPGFDVDRVGIVFTGIGSAGYDRARAEQFYRDVRTRLNSVPGIARVSWATNMPMFAHPSRSLTVEGHEERKDAAPAMTIVNAVDTDFFATTGIVLTRGREFSDVDRDDSPRVAIVNEAVAARYWPGVDPIGRRLTLSGDTTPREVVGIAKTTTYTSIGEAPQPCVYVPLQQQFSDAAILYVRANGDPTAALGTAQRHLRAMDSRIDAADARTVGTIVGQSLFGVTIGVGLLGIFGVIALGLASLGLYGSMAYTVRQRQREIGVRMALGAERGGVMRLVLRQGLAIASTGFGVGIALALIVGRALAGVLFGVSTADPLAMIAASGILAVTAALACFLPARRASRLDPVEALRNA